MDGHRAPHPARVTGPRHAVPWATSRHTVPLPLHSWQTVCVGDDRFAAGKRGGDHLEKLVAVNRASLNLEIDSHVSSDGRRGGQRGDVFGVGVDGTDIGALGGEVAQGLNTAGRRAGADGDEPTRVGPDLPDPLGILGSW